MKLLRNPIFVGILALVAVVLVFKNALKPLFSRHTSAPPPSTASETAAPVTAPTGNPLSTGPSAVDLSATNRPAASGTNIDWYRIATSASRWVDSTGRDPFRIRSEKSRLAGTSGAMAKLTLNAIWRQTDSTLVVVNNQTLGEGDTILGYRIESIELDHIRVLGPDGREEVSFKSPEAPAQPAEKTESRAP